MWKRRSICETMLTTSTESSPSPSRRLADSSRSLCFSPVSASSNSMRVRRINARSFILFSQNQVPVSPQAVGSTLAYGLQRNGSYPLGRIFDKSASAGASTPDAGQFQGGGMAVLNPILAYQALLAIVVKLDAVGAVETIVLDILHLPRYGDLGRADELQAALHVAAVVGVYDRNDPFAQLSVWQGPVTRHPRFCLSHVLPPIDAHVNAVRLSNCRHLKLFAIVVTLAGKLLQAAVLPGLLRP